ncbi:MAG: hypothetical protein ACP5I4_12235 [Oceanipulchritudo sp.]
MKVFLDANILFSAADDRSQVHRFVRFLADKGVAASSDYALAEAARNILLKRPHCAGGLRELAARIAIVQSCDAPVPVRIADKDRPILATAVRARCDYLVTGDQRDFGHLFGQSVGPTRIVTVLMMREVLQELLSGPDPRTS